MPLESTPASADAVDEFERHDRGRVLDPIDRTSEVLFGLFMVLTFTGTLSVASAGRDDVKLMLVAAIGCNTAWGFVDGVMYVLRSMVVRAREGALRRAVRAAPRPADAHRLIAGAIGPLAAGLDTPGLERVRRSIVDEPAEPAHGVRPTARELQGALGVFLLVFASTFPVALPFVLIADPRTAMRVSGAIAIAMLFLSGYGWGRYGGVSAWGAGLVMVVLGVIVESVVIALGG